MQTEEEEAGGESWEGEGEEIGAEKKLEQQKKQSKGKERKWSEE